LLSSCRSYGDYGYVRSTANEVENQIGDGGAIAIAKYIINLNELWISKCNNYEDANKISDIGALAIAVSLV
jgi:hypothetical protein